MDAFVQRVRGRLIVSCQALPDEPLFGAAIMARMAVLLSRAVRNQFLGMRLHLLQRSHDVI